MRSTLLSFIFILCIAQTTFASAVGLNFRPIIGVLTEPLNETAPEEGSFLPASYVKWLESAGARVAPVRSTVTKNSQISRFPRIIKQSPPNKNVLWYKVPYDASHETLQKYFSSLNGILFPGGGLSLQPQTTFYKTAKFFFDQSIISFKKGDSFPIWGTCMGFQLLTILGANDHSVLEEYACMYILLRFLFWYRGWIMPSKPDTDNRRCCFA